MIFCEPNGFVYTSPSIPLHEKGVSIVTGKSVTEEKANIIFADSH
jgi:hypothetical protein